MNTLKPIQLPINDDAVIIDTFRQADLPTLYAIESNPVTKKYLGGPVQCSEVDWIAKLLSRWPNIGIMAIREERDSLPIGRAALAESPFSCLELEIVLGLEGRGRRLGIEIANLLVNEAWRMGAFEVTTKTHPQNVAALRLLESMNFREYESIQTGKYAGFKMHRLRQAAV